MWKIVVIALLGYLALASARPEQYDGYYRDEAKNCVTKQECPEDSPAHTYVENDYALE
ncbi:unnamed protein product [Ixodes pacificus]|uniref:Secreted salivary protein n=1 Tax=Ixodes scapularis TaxID=6945 RepID=B7PCV4_IXOSC|nr:hypothetical protein IscW_ISCW002769 [Ixodes scapularis]|eukprot:XP_002410315.1 hypothetical protein IscW_ISCW002769 [Ixodes scapularis]